MVSGPEQNAKASVVPSLTIGVSVFMQVSLLSLFLFYPYSACNCFEAFPCFKSLSTAKPDIFEVTDEVCVCACVSIGNSGCLSS